MAAVVVVEEKVAGKEARAERWVGAGAETAALAVDSLAVRVAPMEAMLAASSATVAAEGKG